MTLNFQRAALLALPFAALNTVHAEEPPKTLNKIQVESEPEAARTTSATQLPLTLRETPQSVTVFSSEQLEAQKLVSLRQVLDQTPGVYSYQWDTERVIFTSRGFVIDNLMYDSVPAETNFSTDSIEDNIDTSLYERIEIVRGATGLMTGTGSPAASVNLVRKRADAREFTGNLGLTAGSWNDRRIEADVGSALNTAGTIRGRFVGVYQDRESYQDLYQNERKVLYAVVDADVSDNTTLSFSLDFQDNLPTSNTWGSFPLYLGDGSFADWPRSVTTAPDWAFWKRRTESAAAELRHAFDNGWSLRSSLTWREFSEDLALFYVFGYPDPDTGEGLDPYAYRSQGKIISKALDVHLSGPVQWFGREHELVIGFNGSRAHNTADEYAVDGLAPVGNFFEWDGSYPEPAFSDPYLLTDIDSRQNGLYVAGRFSLTDPLKLVAGARVASWKSDHFYLYDSPTETLKTDYRKVIPYAGLIYDVSSNYSLFASFTGIFKPQIERDVERRHLDPVEGRSFEVGIKGEHADSRLNTALTLFETRQDNVAAPAIDPETGEFVEPFPDGTQPSMAIDGTRTRGFELEVAGELNDQWTLNVGWTRYRIEDADGAAIRTYTPGTLVRSFVTWKANARFSLGGGVNWQSDSHTMVGAPIEGAVLRQSEVLMLSLMGRWQVNDALSLQVNGQNLLDEKYFVLDEYDNTYFGAPASVSASINWTF